MDEIRDNCAYVASFLISNDYYIQYKNGMCMSEIVIFNLIIVYTPVYISEE